MLRTCISCRHNVNDICTNNQYATGQSIKPYTPPKCGYRNGERYTPSRPIGYKPMVNLPSLVTLHPLKAISHTLQPT